MARRSYYSRSYGSSSAYYCGGSEQHPGCAGGCGELADECACPPAKRNPLGSMQVVEPAEIYADDDIALPCRRRNCTDPAERGGYCDAHLGTL